jgi:serine/threonine protein kinase
MCVGLCVTQQGMAALPAFVRFKPMERPRLRDTFTGASDDLLALLQGLLTFDPAQRLTAAQALRHPFFSNLPRPTPPTRLPRPGPPVAPGAAFGAAAAQSQSQARSMVATKRERDGEGSPATPSGLSDDRNASRRRLAFS